MQLSIGNLMQLTDFEHSKGNMDILTVMMRISNLESWLVTINA